MIMKIVLIAPGKLPIPCIKGGAIETLSTHLIDENEHAGNAEFIVFQEFDREVEKLRANYTNTTFFMYRKSIVKNVWDFLCRCVNIVFKGFFARYSSHVLWIKNKLKTESPDVIVVEGQRNYILGLMDTYHNLVLHLHTDLLNSETKHGELILKGCDKIIAVSEFISDRVRTVKVTDCDAGKIYVLKNTIDKSKFYFSEDGRKRVRAKYGIRDEDNVAVYCGRISKEKGVLELLQAMDRTNLSNLVLLLIGSSWFAGSALDEYGDAVQKYMKENGLQVVMTGYVGQNELYAYYSAGDFLVVPSICNEAAGLVIPEGISCGLPVIATDIGGIPEFADERCSLLVPYSERFVEDLSKSIETMCDWDVRQRLKSRTYEICGSYSTKAYYDSFLSILNSD